MTLRWLPAMVLLIMLCPLPRANGHPTMEEDITMDQAMMRASHEEFHHHKSSSPSRASESEHMSGYDMKLTHSQYLRLHGGVKSSRASGTILAVPWTNGDIPYDIRTQDFNDDQLTWIHKAMADWQNLTCVRFRPANASDTDHKILIRKGNGCWAHLGMIDQNPQIVNLEATGVGCFWKGLIHHELGHTIGLIHEHQREQRDAFIRINYYMVMSNMIDAVEKYARGADDKMGLPYDYTSVMHYGKTAFSAGFYRQTIHTRDPNMLDVIGMTLLPSFYDAKLVNLMYNCADKCHSPPSCSEKCFVNEHCQCVCKEDMPKEVCKDLLSDCAGRAAQGNCINHYGTMHHSCRKTCGICTNGTVPHLLCVDGHTDCQDRAQNGGCETDFGRMQYDCRLTCGLCQTPDMLPSPGPCVDKNATCHEMAANGDCYRNMAAMLRDCTKTCEFCPENIGDDPTDKPGCVDYDPGACYYRADNNLCNKFYALMATKCPVACEKCNFNLPQNCTDSNSECPGWAFGDECFNNPGYMLKGCPMSCDTCEGLNKPDVPCEDYNLNCQDYKERKECFANPNWMSRNCKRSCGHCPGDPPFGIPCDDFNDRCPRWASEGECQNNKGWMFPHCKLSCGQCEPGSVDYNNGTCRDDNLECYYWSVNDECERNPGFMLKSCKKSCKVCSPDGGSTINPGTPTTPPHTGPCFDVNENCAAWARNRECTKNPSFMLRNCRRSCSVCTDDTSPCVDNSEYCPEWQKNQQCSRNPGYMLRHCRVSCDNCD